jgi:acyl-CoA thioester hydrolase
MLRRMSQPFPLSIQVPIAWGDMDAFGHVNNTVYFRLFEDARIRFFEEVGVGHRGPAAGGCAPILAATQCQFRVAMTYPDTARVETGISHVGRSSFTMRYRVHSERQGRLAAEGEGVVVWYDYEAQRSVALPDELRRRIEGMRVAAVDSGAPAGAQGPDAGKEPRP